MSHNTNTQKGFTLVELLISIAILSGLAVVSTRLLWDTVSTRAKQYSIEQSSENFRLIISTVSNSIRSATTVEVPNAQTIEITGEPCRTFRYDATTQVLEQAIDSSPTCVPPTSGFESMIQEQIALSSFSFSPVETRPQSVIIETEGTYTDSLGSHPFSYSTTVTPRTTL